MKQRTKQPMKLGTKLILILLGGAALILLIYQGYLTVRFRLHRDYRNVLSGSAEFEAGTPFNGRADAAAPTGMLLAAENSELKLFLNPNTAEAAVLDLRTGEMTYTNPPDAERDPIAGRANISLLRSQIVVEYFDSARRPGQFNTFSDSTSICRCGSSLAPDACNRCTDPGGQFEIESIQNGFRITYTLGDMSHEFGLVPTYITEERLNFFVNRLETPRDRSFITSRYVPSEVAPGFLELQEAIRERAATILDLNALFAQTGYTHKDLADDMEASGVEGATSLGFIIPLEYRLDGDGVVVSIPTAQIGEMGGGRISRLQVLPFLGAAGLLEEGYMVVPNGSGSLIYFNNEKTFADDYMQYVYGLDPLLDDVIVPGNREPARMPYFGIQRTGRNSQGILAEIQIGTSLADITASIAGIVGVDSAVNKPNSYNFVHASFTLRGSMSLAMFGTTGNEATMPIVEPEMALVDLTIRYSFLHDEYEGYSGMARYARERLIQRGILTPDTESGDIPMYMTLLGSVAGQKRALSVAYWGQFPMTTFEQAEEITDRLAAQGITNQVISYQGWFNRGYYHDVPGRINLISQLGSRRELENLSRSVEDRGGRLYLDVAFQQVSFMSRRYNWSMETSRYFAGGSVAILGQTCPDCYSPQGHLTYRETLYNLLSPKFLGRYVDNFISSFERYNVTGISLRDLGCDLHSDRRRTEIITREEALEIVVDSLEKLEDAAPLMISGGNAYSFGFATDIINMPISHNEFFIVDVEIPFMQMVLNGSISYAGTPINLSSAFDEDEIAARLIEFGASPHFTFTYQPSSDIKYTGMNHIHASTFDNWEETAVRIYNKVNNALSLVSGSHIVQHEILSGGTRRVTYSNGVVFEIDRETNEVNIIGRGS
jgi:hypothetical protein